jgi:hypothetical protein
MCSTIQCSESRARNVIQTLSGESRVARCSHPLARFVRVRPPQTSTAEAGQTGRSHCTRLAAHGQLSSRSNCISEQVAEEQNSASDKRIFSEASPHETVLARTESVLRFYKPRKSEGQMNTENAQAVTLKQKATHELVQLVAIF